MVIDTLDLKFLDLKRIDTLAILAHAFLSAVASKLNLLIQIKTIIELPWFLVTPEIVGRGLCFATTSAACGHRHRAFRRCGLHGAISSIELR